MAAASATWQKDPIKDETQRKRKSSRAVQKMGESLTFIRTILEETRTKGLSCGNKECRVREERRANERRGEMVCLKNDGAESEEWERSIKGERSEW